MGNPREGGEDATGGSGTECLLPAPRQPGAGTAGGTALGGRDEDEGDRSETVLTVVVDFRAVMSSLMTMKEEDGFRKIVMYL